MSFKNITILVFGSLMLVLGTEGRSFGKPNSAGKAAAGREKIISREGRTKSNSKTKIDFEDTDIGGARKTPMASMLNNTKAKKDYDLVPIRTDWKPEMVQSASSLDAGKAR